VNKVNTAVRATHIPTGISVFAQDYRSQLENKKLAIERLKEKILRLELKKLENQMQEKWKNHLQVQRGNPIRSFKGTGFKKNYTDSSFKKKRNSLKNELKNYRNELD